MSDPPISTSQASTNIPDHLNPTTLPTPSSSTTDSVASTYKAPSKIALEAELEPPAAKRAKVVAEPGSSRGKEKTQGEGTSAGKDNEEASDSKDPEDAEEEEEEKEDEADHDYEEGETVEGQEIVEKTDDDEEYDPNKIYAMEKIVNCQCRNGEVNFRIKWEGYKALSWQPKHVIVDFENNLAVLEYLAVEKNEAKYKRELRKETATTRKEKKQDPNFQPGRSIAATKPRRPTQGSKPGRRASKQSSSPPAPEAPPEAPEKKPFEFPPTIALVPPTAPCPFFISQIFNAMESFRYDENEGIPWDLLDKKRTEWIELLKQDLEAAYQTQLLTNPNVTPVEVAKDFDMYKLHRLKSTKFFTAWIDERNYIEKEEKKAEEEVLEEIPERRPRPRLQCMWMRRNPNSRRAQREKRKSKKMERENQKKRQYEGPSMPSSSAGPSVVTRRQETLMSPPGIVEPSAQNISKVQGHTETLTQGSSVGPSLEALVSPPEVSLLVDEAVDESHAPSSAIEAQGTTPAEPSESATVQEPPQEPLVSPPAVDDESSPDVEVDPEVPLAPVVVQAEVPAPPPSVQEAQDAQGSNYVESTEAAPSIVLQVSPPAISPTVEPIVEPEDPNADVVPEPAPAIVQAVVSELFSVLEAQEAPSSVAKAQEEVSSLPLPAVPDNGTVPTLVPIDLQVNPEVPTDPAAHTVFQSEVPEAQFDDSPSPIVLQVENEVPVAPVAVQAVVSASSSVSEAQVAVSNLPMSSAVSENVSSPASPSPVQHAAFTSQVLSPAPVALQVDPEVTVAPVAVQHAVPVSDAYEKDSKLLSSIAVPRNDDSPSSAVLSPVQKAASTSEFLSQASTSMAIQIDKVSVEPVVAQNIVPVPEAQGNVLEVYLSEPPPMALLVGPQVFVQPAAPVVVQAVVPIPEAHEEVSNISMPLAVPENDTSTAISLFVREAVSTSDVLPPPPAAMALDPEVPVVPAVVQAEVPLTEAQEEASNLLMPRGPPTVPGNDPSSAISSIVQQVASTSDVFPQAPPPLALQVDTAVSSTRSKVQGEVSSLLMPLTSGIPSNSTPLAVPTASVQDQIRSFLEGSLASVTNHCQSIQWTSTHVPSTSTAPHASTVSREGSSSVPGPSTSAQVPAFMGVMERFLRDQTNNAYTDTDGLAQHRESPSPQEAGFSSSLYASSPASSIMLRSPAPQDPYSADFTPSALDTALEMELFHRTRPNSTAQQAPEPRTDGIPFMTMIMELIRNNNRVMEQAQQQQRADIKAAINEVFEEREAKSKVSRAPRGRKSEAQKTRVFEDAQGEKFVGRVRKIAAGKKRESEPAAENDEEESSEAGPSEPARKKEKKDSESLHEDTAGPSAPPKKRERRNKVTSDVKFAEKWRQVNECVKSGAFEDIVKLIRDIPIHRPLDTKETLVNVVAALDPRPAKLVEALHRRGAYPTIPVEQQNQTTRNFFSNLKYRLGIAIQKRWLPMQFPRLIIHNDANNEEHTFYTFTGQNLENFENNQSVEFEITKVEEGKKFALMLVPFKWIRMAFRCLAINPPMTLRFTTQIWNISENNPSYYEATPIIGINRIELSSKMESPSMIVYPIWYTEKENVFVDLSL